MSANNQDSSVLFSLQELEQLEHERIQEEEHARAEAARRAELEEQLRKERAREAEAQRQAAEAAERARRAAESAAEEARLQALKQAIIEKARLESQSKAALQTAQLEQRHQLELLGLKYRRALQKMRAAIGVAVAIVLCGGGVAAAWMLDDSAEQHASVKLQATQLSERHAELLKSRLAELDSRHSSALTLLERTGDPSDEVDVAQTRAAAARAKIEVEGIDEAGLGSFAQALDELSAGLDQMSRRQRLAALDEVHTKLQSAIARLRYPNAEIAEAAAHATTIRRNVDPRDPTERTLAELHGAHQRLALALAGLQAGPVVPPSGSVPPPVDPPTETCSYHDPLCKELLR